MKTKLIKYILIRRHANTFYHAKILIVIFQRCRCRERERRKKRTMNSKIKLNFYVIFAVNLCFFPTFSLKYGYICSLSVSFAHSHFWRVYEESSFDSVQNIGGAQRIDHGILLSCICVCVCVSVKNECNNAGQSSHFIQTMIYKNERDTHNKWQK